MQQLSKLQLHEQTTLDVTRGFVLTFALISKTFNAFGILSVQACVMTPEHQEKRVGLTYRLGDIWSEV